MQPLPFPLSPLSVGLNHITHKIERVRVSEERTALAGVSTVDLPRPVAGDGVAAAASEGAEGGERTALGRVIDRSGGEREGGEEGDAARALRLWTSMVGGRTDGSGEGEGALRDERLGQRESGGTGRLQLVHYN